jgi:hypothetical protein
MAESSSLSLCFRLRQQHQSYDVAATPSLPTGSTDVRATDTSSAAILTYNKPNSGDDIDMKGQGHVSQMTSPTSKITDPVTRPFTPLHRIGLISMTTPPGAPGGPDYVLHSPDMGWN